MKNSKIHWADHSYNPWWVCNHLPKSPDTANKENHEPTRTRDVLNRNYSPDANISLR